jgi:hypothetical protein
VQHVDAALQLSNGHLLPAFKQLTATYSAAAAAAVGKKGNRCFRIRIHRGSGGICVLRTKQKIYQLHGSFFYYLFNSFRAYFLLEVHSKLLVVR